MSLGYNDRYIFINIKRYELKSKRIECFTPSCLPVLGIEGEEPTLAVGGL
jgi:hypothetical protein